MAKKQNSRVHERWAAFRFSVIGRLLAAPPRKGELRAEIEALAAQEWQHPITGEQLKFVMPLPKDMATLIERLR